MGKRFILFLMLCVFAFNPVSEAKKFKTPYQMKKSAYFRSPSQTGYFQSNEPEWYKKPFIWTVDGIKTMGTTIDELIS